MPAFKRISSASFLICQIPWASYLLYSTIYLKIKFLFLSSLCVMYKCYQLIFPIDIEAPNSIHLGVDGLCEARACFVIRGVRLFI